jgi:hypothetical protein
MSDRRSQHGTSSPAAEAVSGGGGSSSRSAAKRLLKELETWRSEMRDETGIERLGPHSEDDIFRWEAVVNGRDVGSGYDGKSCHVRSPKLYKRALRDRHK